MTSYDRSSVGNLGSTSVQEPSWMREDTRQEPGKFLQFYSPQAHLGAHKALIKINKVHCLAFGKDSIILKNLISTSL